MRVSAALVVAAATIASAAVEEYGSSLNMTIDPNSVEEGTRGEYAAAPGASAAPIVALAHPD